MQKFRMTFPLTYAGTIDECLKNEKVAFDNRMRSHAMTMMMQKWKSKYNLDVEPTFDYEVKDGEAFITIETGLDAFLREKNRIREMEEKTKKNKFKATMWKVSHLFSPVKSKSLLEKFKEYEKISKGIIKVEQII